MNYMERLNMRRQVPRIKPAGGEKKKAYHPRELYRGLTVEYSTAPGRKRIHQKGGQK